MFVRRNDKLSISECALGELFGDNECNLINAKPAEYNTQSSVSILYHTVYNACGYIRTPISFCWQIVRAREVLLVRVQAYKI